MFHIFSFRFLDYIMFESFDPWYELRNKIGATGTFVVIAETKIKVNHLEYIVPRRLYSWRHGYNMVFARNFAEKRGWW